MNPGLPLRVTNFRPHFEKTYFKVDKIHDQILKLAKIYAEMKRWIAAGEGNCIYM